MHSIMICWSCALENRSLCYCADSVGVDESESDYPMEYLNSLCSTGLPLNKLCLKVGSIVMWLRDIKGIKGPVMGQNLLLYK